MIYPWLGRFWPEDTIWGIGDHEIGDIWSNGRIKPLDPRYGAFRAYKRVWRRHHGGRTFYRRDVGPVTVITLDPFLRTALGIVPEVRPAHLRQLRQWVRRARADGDWVIIQSELPAKGPNRAPPRNLGGTSGLRIANGSEVLAAADGADLFLAAEYHWPTVRRSPRGPVQIVHGGTHRQFTWLTIDVLDDRLELALRRSISRRGRRRAIWTSDGPRGTDSPVPGPVERLGTATLRRDGRWRARGALRPPTTRRR